MSGHSKWATIKRDKEKNDVKKGKIFTRFSRDITVAAREGGGDPQGNAKLRLLIDKARQSNMPNDNIERAIKKGTGEIAGESYEAFRYEGYAPHGIAFIVEALSDNKNRTISDIRHFCTKRGGSIVADGAVSWMFGHYGELILKGVSCSEESLFEEFLEYGIEECSVQENQARLIIQVVDFEKAKTHAEKLGLEIDHAELAWIATTTTQLSPEATAEVEQFFDGFDELDDVQNIYSNLARE